jgi:outer membrane protein, multidrug efflux system
LPLAIILIVPMCLLFAMAGVWLSKGDNNIFTQIGLIVLVGLACKNAILIVEFAKHKQDEGLSPAEAALEACRLRLRPILMTSIAFIAGVFPLVVSTGAGAEMRRAMGTAVFAGMIGVTLFGLFLTPVFYVVLMKLGSRKPKTASAPGHPPLGSPGVVTGTAVLLLTLVSGHSALMVGPDYVPPTAPAETPYKHGGTAPTDVHTLALRHLRGTSGSNEVHTLALRHLHGGGGVPGTNATDWKIAAPRDYLAKGAWWEMFGDPVLNNLEEQASSGNLDVRAALQRVEQARATARIRFGELFPEGSINPSFRRERYSPNQEPSFGAITADTIRVPLDLSYEIDIFGRVRRGFEAARAEAEGARAAYHSLLLTLQADVAINYFRLRALDSEIEAVARTVGLREEQLSMVRGRFDAGAGSELDLARAAAELATAQAEASALARQRSELENALAILTGNHPSDFVVASDPSRSTAWGPEPPVVPVGLPSDLLERRPDVAEAERQIAAANARIGIARAAAFPVFRLTGSGGYVSGEFQNLFDWDSRVWSIGPSVSIPLFAGGRNRANKARANAAYEEAVLRYRQRVLQAFADVENSLAALQFLAEQKAAQDRALLNSRKAAELAEVRYRAGIVGYLEVVDANRAVLQTERASVQLAGQRFASAVLLIKALGGGWTLDPVNQ